MLKKWKFHYIHLFGWVPSISMFLLYSILIFHMKNHQSPCVWIFGMCAKGGDQIFYFWNSNIMCVIVFNKSNIYLNFFVLRTKYCPLEWKLVFFLLIEIFHVDVFVHVDIHTSLQLWTHTWTFVMCNRSASTSIYGLKNALQDKCP